MKSIPVTTVTISTVYLDLLLAKTDSAGATAYTSTVEAGQPSYRASQRQKHPAAEAANHQLS